jgi:hypothetical protein
VPFCRVLVSDSNTRIILPVSESIWEISTCETAGACLRGNIVDLAALCAAEQNGFNPLSVINTSTKSNHRTRKDANADVFDYIERF